MALGIVAMAVIIGIVSTLLTYFGLRRFHHFRNALSLDELDSLCSDDADVTDDVTRRDVKQVMLRSGTLRSDVPGDTISNPVMNSRYGAVNQCYREDV